MRYRIIAMIFSLSTMLAGGCSTKVVPPAEVSDPVPIYPSNYGRHASLILPAGGEGEDCGDRSRDRLDRDATLASKTHDAIAGIRNDRHARIADQRERVAAFEPFDEMRRSLVFVVLVIALRRPIDGEMRQQLSSVACVFAEDQVR